MNNSELIEISIKLTKEELEIIRKVATKCSISETDCIRTVLFHRNTEIMKELFTEQIMRDIRNTTKCLCCMKDGTYAGKLNEELRSLKDSVENLKDL